MKNFKKLFASVAIVAMLATAIPTTVLGAATYSEELQGAYDYAYGNGITTQSTIDSANMYGSLTRVAMAKMMANYAIEVLGQTPDTSKDCTFADVSAELDAQYDNGVTNACQLGLMGVGINAFNPNGLVTRAEFGTVLSRALYGDTYNVDTNPYYAEHLAALKDAGIMTQIDTPSKLEQRGLVMLMMQRATGASTPAVCETPENVLSCSLGLDTCPTECQTVVAKEGTLTMSSVGVDYTSIPRAGDVVFGSMKLAADTDVTVNSITMKLQGLVSVSDLGAGARVYFEKDGVRISSKTSFNSTDKTALVTFTTPLVVKSSENIDVILSLTTGAIGTDVQLASTAVNSSAQTVNGSFTSAVLRMTSYVVANTVLDNDASYYSNTKTVKVDSTALVTLGGIKITKQTPTTDRAVLVNAITLNNSGNAELTYLDGVALYRDDVQVSTKTTMGDRTISFVLNNEIKNTETNATYVIKAKVNGADRINDVYDLYVRYTTDVVAIEKDTSFRVQNTGTPSVAYAKISGGDLRFNENTISSLTVTPGAKKVQFYTGTLVALQSVRLDTLTGLAITLPSGVAKLADVLDNLYVQIGSSIISASTLDLTNTGIVSFEGEVNFDGTVPFIVYGDVKSNYISGGFIQFTTPISTAKFNEAKYVADDSTAASIGSIGGRKATISTSSLTLTNSSSNVNVQKGDRNVEIAKLEFATNSDIVIRLSSFAMTMDVTGDFKDSQVTLYNEAGTTAIASAVLRTVGTAQTLDSFTFTPVSISKGVPTKFIVKLDQVPNTVVAGDLLTGYVKTGSMVAKDIVSTLNVNPLANTNSTVLTVVAAGIPEVVSQIYTPILVRYGATGVQLGTVDLKSTNGNVVMRNAYFAITGLAAGEINQINSLKLLENGVVISSSLLKNGNYVYATDLNRTITSTPKTYSVVADINTINNSASAITSTPTMKMYVNVLTGTCIDGYSTFETVGGTGGVSCTNFTGGTALSTKDMSSTIKFVNEVPTITAISTYANGGDIVYKITLNSTKLTQLTGISLVVSPTNLSGYSAYAALSKVFVAANDSTYATNNYLTGTSINVLSGITTLTTDVNLNGSNIVYVVFKGLADLEATNAQADRKARIELTNISYADNFDTGKTSNIGMLTSFKSSIVGSLLLSNTLTW